MTEPLTGDEYQRLCLEVGRQMAAAIVQLKYGYHDSTRKLVAAFILDEKREWPALR